MSQPCDHRPPNTSRPGITPGKAQQCQTEDRDNSRDLVEVEGHYKQHRVLFLTRGFGRKIRKVTCRGPRKLPPLGFACPELPAFLASGGFSRLGEHSPGQARAPRNSFSSPCSTWTMVSVLRLLTFTRFHLHTLKAIVAALKGEHLPNSSVLLAEKTQSSKTGVAVLPGTG